MLGRRSRKNIRIEGLLVPEIGPTDAGSVRVLIRPAPPVRSLYGHERKVAAFIHDLATALERRCDELGVGWAIFAEPFNSRLDVELGEHNDPQPAVQVVAGLLADLGLG
jgi:hypothetical protein